MYSNILDSEQIQNIINSPSVLEAKSRISGSNQVYFTAELSDSVKDSLKESMGLDLYGIKDVPMRWIQGNTADHIDRGEESFTKTHLVYLTDSEGEFVLDGNEYPIKRGSGFTFSEGLHHETRNTGSEPRLLLGPMSENGFRVGVTPLATGGTITQYTSGATITWFHTFTTITNFTATSAITGLNYVLVGGGNAGGVGGGGEDGTGVGTGGQGGKYLVGSISSFPSGDHLQITQISTGSDNTETPPDDTEMYYPETTSDYTSNSGTPGGVAGANGFNIPNYRNTTLNGGYICSGGGNGNNMTGGSGGLGNTSGKGGGDGEDGGTSTQFGGGGGGGGPNLLLNGTSGGYGGNGAVIIYYSIYTAPPPVSVCFLEGTPVETDQGEIAINKLDTQVNTINGKRILAVTQTPGEKDCLVIIKKDLLGENKPNKDTIISKWHRVFYDEEMEEACRIPDTELVPYNGEILYNVLLDDHETMKVNGLTVETLDPDHKVAKYYRSLLN